MAEIECDVVVVGLGPGGEAATGRLARAGLDVVGVDRHLVGGECPFYGCVPSKVMIRASDSLAEARRAGAIAGEVSVRPDFARLLRRLSDDVTAGWTDDSHVTALQDAGARVVHGSGTLDGPRRVRVGDDVYVARRGVLLDPGTSPARLPIDGLADTPYWTNREVFRAEGLPASLTVVGGGPIGAELAQVFARFGTQVRVVEVGERLVGREEPEASALLQRVFEREGIEVVTGVGIERVDHDGAFTVRLADGRELASEQLLVGAGRTPNLSGLGLGSVGLSDDARGIEVDDRMRAGDGLWALGDVVGHGAFTHVSMYQSGIAVADILGEDGPRAEYHAVSRVTFTDPEIGSVGMTEAEAREAGLAVRTGLTDLAESSRGWMHGLGTPEGVDGLIKLVVADDVLVGATSVGPTGGEVLGLLALAVHARVPVETVRGMHFAYPTFHRAIESALADLG